MSAVREGVKKECTNSLENRGARGLSSLCKFNDANRRYAVERLRAAARRAGGGDAGEHGAHQGAPPNASCAAATERSVYSAGRASRRCPSADA